MAAKASEIRDTPSPKMVKSAMAFYNDPLGFVWWAFPWGQPNTQLARPPFSLGPDLWQSTVLSQLGEELRKRAGTAEQLAAVSAAIRLAVASGHGIGKTALVSWIILWFITTRPNPQIVVTANTDTQLKTKTWRELSKWHELAINRGWFNWSATQFKLKSDPTKWYATAIPWSESNPTAFAGTHERHVLIIFDEASEISDVIWDTTQGALTTAGMGGDVIWIAFGNPTQSTGRFRDCWTKFRKRWITANVDSRTARMANTKLMEEWIEDYGLDNDFVKVRVLGQFPSQGPTQFIGSDDVDLAVVRDIDEKWIPNTTPRLMGIDVARQGDDESVIVRRWGPKLPLPIKRYRVPDLMQIAAYGAEEINKWKPDTVFVDADGMGVGVYDRLIQLGFEDVVVPVFSGKTTEVLEKDRFYNPRIEMWNRMREWLKTADIPEDRQLYDDLIGPQYQYDMRHRMRLEKKEDMKSRGIPSPDTADALAFTFAFPVPMKRQAYGEGETEPEVT